MITTIIIKKYNSTEIRGNLNDLSSFIIIFDFDGTICNNFSVCVDIYNKIANRINCKKVLNEEIDELRSMKPHCIMNKLNISKWKLPYLAYKLRKEMKSKISLTTPHDGIKNILSSLNKKKISTILLTSNSYNNVKVFLNKHEMNFFNVICTGVSTFGKSKILNLLRKKGEMNKNTTYYVGDEVRDIYACKKSNTKIISVSWGVNNHDALKENNPNYICNNSQDLQNVLDKIIVN